MFEIVDTHRLTIFELKNFYNLREEEKQNV